MCFDHPLSRTVIFICTFQGWHLSPQPTERQQIPRLVKDATSYGNFHIYGLCMTHQIQYTEHAVPRDLMPELPTCRPLGKAVNPGTLPWEKYCTSFCIHTKAGLSWTIKKFCFGGHVSFSLVLFLPKPLHQLQKIKIQSHTERSLSPRRLQSILFFVT